MWMRWILQAAMHEAAAERMRRASGKDSHPQSFPVETAPSSLAGVWKSLTANLPEPSPCQIAVLMALEIEAGGLYDKLSPAQRQKKDALKVMHGLLHDLPVSVVLTGVGQDSARAAAEQVLNQIQPAWIVSAGFAGGLSSQLRRGDLLMADRVAGLEGESLAVGLQLSPRQIEQSPGLHLGKLLTVNALVRSPAERKELAQSTGALACDMESLAVAEVCRTRKTRFLSVRIISDGWNDTLPPEVEKLLGQTTTAGRIGSAAGALFRRPAAAADFWRLHQQATKLSDRLANFLAGVIRQLADSS